jgi:hypothetical protein
VNLPADEEQTYAMVKRVWKAKLRMTQQVDVSMGQDQNIDHVAEFGWKTQKRRSRCIALSARTVCQYII